MGYFTFLSLDRPKEVGYHVSTSRKYESAKHGVCAWAQFFSTYGDGSVQHSAEVPFAREMLPDFLASMAHHIVNARPHEQEEMLDVLESLWPNSELPRDRIKFALSLKYKEGKTQYYELNERKVSTADSKRHDKRWEVVGSNLDGTIIPAYGIVSNSYGTLIECVARLTQVCDVFKEENDGYCPVDVWKHFGIPNDHWDARTAWEAVNNLVQAYRLRTWAKRAIVNHVENMERRRENAERAATDAVVGEALDAQAVA